MIILFNTCGYILLDVYSKILNNTYIHVNDSMELIKQIQSSSSNMQEKTQHFFSVERKIKKSLPWMKRNNRSI